MSQETKIQLLPFEIDLVSKADLILTKNAVLKKLAQFLEEMQSNQQTFIKKNLHQLPKEIFKVSSKISRGENYKGLPWLVLDNPRHFEKNNVFAIRTMFWWGNFFSTTLHISGKYKKMLEEKIFSDFQILDQQNFFLCVGQSEWEHHFEETNYQSISSIPSEEIKKIMEGKKFLKIATRTPIETLQQVEDVLTNNYKNLFSLFF